MTAEAYIHRRQPDPEGLDFEGLRKEGIRLVQEMSGDIWTDYNLHDPGITILEVLCYALTDLVYRSGFDVADYLAAPDGELDFARLALYRPDEIFPSRAITASDYRRLILGAVPNIDNVWVQPAGSGMPGLYRISIQLNNRVKNQEAEAVRNVYAGIVEKVYAANRNLCEDVEALEIVERIPYSLSGEIEVEGRREPASILAEIYYECAQFLSPQAPIHSYLEMYKSGRSLEELFTGVLTKHGYIAEEELPPWRGDFSIPGLLGRIGAIEGVRDVKRLAFVDSEGREQECVRLDGKLSCRAVACLKFPSGEDGLIRIRRSGKPYLVSLGDVETEFARLDYNSEMLRRRRQDFDWIHDRMPSASRRKFSEYHSIQNHLPEFYGLNAYGVPDSYPAERKAQAKQLKAYLLFFEQIMANYLQNLQEIHRMFSLEKPLGRSYFHQVLDNGAVPGAETVYLAGVERMDAALTRLVAGLDNHEDRHNRVLDYLLGLYGERLGLGSLRQFMEENAYVENERIESKAAFLGGMAEVNRDRAAGFDYLNAPDEKTNVSGLKRKLQILLGLKTAAGEREQCGEKIQVVEHVLLRPLGKARHESVAAADDFYGFRATVLFPAGCGRFANAEFQRLAEETVFLNCPAHIFPGILWLEPEAMAGFDALHGEWLKARRCPDDGYANCDAAAERLIAFLLDAGKQA